MKKTKQEYEDLRVIYKIVFGGEEGEKVLDDLADKCYVARTTYDDNPNTMYFREGRRDLYFYIIKMLSDETSL
jgi:hypothetical protein